MTPHFSRPLWQRLLLAAVLSIPAAVMAYIDMRIALDGKEGTQYVLTAYAVSAGFLLVMAWFASYEHAINMIFQRAFSGVGLAGFAIPVVTIVQFNISPAKDPILPSGLIFAGALVAGIFVGVVALWVAYVVGD